jgi:hypothetical protein
MPPETSDPAMQLTACKPAICASDVCRERPVCAGLVVADVVFRYALNTHLLAVPIAAAALLSGCAASGVLPGDGWTVTHYDLNRDGRVDYSVYDQPQMADEEFSLRDTDADGRYDVRYSLAWGTIPTRVDQRVPTSAPVTPGQPPGGVPGWKR